jgi:hypothetical protein
MSAPRIQWRQRVAHRNPVDANLEFNLINLADIANIVKHERHRAGFVPLSG